MAAEQRAVLYERVAMKGFGVLGYQPLIPVKARAASTA